MIGWGPAEDVSGTWYWDATFNGVFSSASSDSADFATCMIYLFGWAPPQESKTYTLTADYTTLGPDEALVHYGTGPVAYGDTSILPTVDMPASVGSLELIVNGGSAQIILDK